MFLPPLCPRTSCFPQGAVLSAAFNYFSWLITGFRDLSMLTGVSFFFSPSYYTCLSLSLRLTPIQNRSASSKVRTKPHPPTLQAPPHLQERLSPVETARVHRKGWVNQHQRHAETRLAWSRKSPRPLLQLIRWHMTNVHENSQMLWLMIRDLTEKLIQFCNYSSYFVIVLH